MRILVIGSGGREHALTHTFKRQGHSVYCLPGNAGTQEISEKLPEKWKSLDVYDFERLTKFVKQEGIALTVVGPEEFLDKGIANVFAAHALPLFGPTKEVARLETSKAWAKNFMFRNNIPTARYFLCRHPEVSKDKLQSIFSTFKGVVIKPSGLTGGKGVVCCDSLEEAEAVLYESQYLTPDSEFVIEEKLQGPEISLLAFCDGKTILPMIPSQDHKRLYDHETGPNTGGMGAFAPVPFMTESLTKDIHTLVENTLKALKKEQIHYIGILYFGLMITQEGPKVLEFNCRFGDPETQALLPLLKTNLASVMLACCHGQLHTYHLEWEQQYCCCVVIASHGYPDQYPVGISINAPAVFPSQRILFHAGTKRDGSGAIVSSGGRVLGVAGLGSTLNEAVQEAYQGVRSIEFSGGHYRTDIALQGLKVEEMDFV